MMQFMKPLVLSASLLISALVIAAPDAKPVSMLPAGQGNMNVAASDSVVQQTTRPGGQMAPAFCQNMTPDQCQQMKVQKKQQKLAQWQQLTPEQKQALQQKMQQEWQQMSPAEKQMLKEHLMQKWQAMSPSEQAQMLQQMHQLQAGPGAAVPQGQSN